MIIERIIYYPLILQFDSKICRQYDEFTQKFWRETLDFVFIQGTPSI